MKPRSRSRAVPGTALPRLAGVTLAALGTVALAGASDDLPAKALRELERALKEQTGFVQIHAAEALAATGHADLARSAFSDPAIRSATNPPDTARIGKWRVRALTSANDAERADWIAKVRAVAVDAAAVDRLQAVETLGKLQVRLAEAEVSSIRHWAENSPVALASFPWWVVHVSGAADALPRIVAGLDAPDPIARLRAAYILKRDHLTGAHAAAAVARAWSTEKPDSPAYAYLLCAQATLTENPADRAAYIEQLGKFATNPANTAGRYEACLTLMTLWPPENAAQLAPVLECPDADTRVGAAWAILHLAGRAKSKAGQP